MAVAMIRPEPEKGGRGKKLKGTEAVQFSKMRLSQARAILASSPETALDVALMRTAPDLVGVPR